MSTGEARHGRRDNGLVAAEYAAAGDVDPRVGEHLLDVLALDGIAAYLRPSTDLHPITRQSFLPARPTDRLYVDRTHLATARTYLDRLAAESTAEPTGDSTAAGSDGTGAPVRSDPTSAPRDPAGQPPAQPRGRVDGASTNPNTGPRADPDTDDEWAKIVAGYDAEVDTVRRSWPAVEDLADRADGRDDPTPGLGAGRPQARDQRTRERAEADEPSLLDALDTFGADLPDEDDAGYTPPTPPPVPRPSMPAVLGVAGIVGGLAMFLRPDLVPIGENTAMLMGFLAIMAGFATLVWRLRPGDDDEDPDPDDGARV